MTHDYAHAVENTTIGGNLLAINACVSNIRQNIDATDGNLNDHLNLIDEATAVLRDQISAPKNWFFVRALNKVDTFFYKNEALYYSIMLMIVIFCIIMVPFVFA